MVLRCVIDNHQCALFGKAFYLDGERLFGDVPVDQQAVIDKNGGGVAGKPAGEGDGIYFIENPVFRFSLLQPHAHVNEDYDYEDDGKGKNTVAYHKLFVGVKTMCHIRDSFKNIANVVIKIEPADFSLS